MREILFRGKRADTGEWMYWSSMGRLSKPYYGKLVSGKIGYSHWAYECLFIEDKTIGQYTGLIDKNGKRIFEEDIVYSIYTKKNYPVCFGEYKYTNDYGDEESAFGWYTRDADYGDYITLGNTEDWAVIVGNIHDNHKLLKTEE